MRAIDSTPENIVRYGEFIRGYRAALTDLKETLTRYDMKDDLKKHGRSFNQAEIVSFISCLIENTRALADRPDAFIRCASRKKCDWECFDSETRKVVGKDDEHC